jgi:hypothetical protein
MCSGCVALHTQSLNWVIMADLGKNESSQPGQTCLSLKEHPDNCCVCIGTHPSSLGPGIEGAGERKGASYLGPAWVCVFKKLSPLHLQQRVVLCTGIWAQCIGVLSSRIRSKNGKCEACLKHHLQVINSSWSYSYKFSWSFFLIYLVSLEWHSITFFVWGHCYLQLAMPCIFFEVCSIHRWAVTKSELGKPVLSFGPLPTVHLSWLDGLELAVPFAACVRSTYYWNERCFPRTRSGERHGQGDLSWWWVTSGLWISSLQILSHLPGKG